MISSEYSKEMVLGIFCHKAELDGMRKGIPAKLLIDDQTLLFANSTIAGFKDAVLSQALPEKTIYIIQECIRANNLKTYSDPSEELKYMSVFSQLGLLGDENSLVSMLDFIKTFFFDGLMVPESAFRIRTSSSIKWNRLIENEFSSACFELNSRDESYYNWSYGVAGLSGVGATIAIYNDINDEFQDIGNIIQLNLNKETVGFEFGFGLETLLARLNYFDSPFEYTISEMGGDHSLISNNRKLLDSLMVSVYLLHLGVCEGRSKRSSVLRGALNSLMYQCIINAVSLNSILNITKRYLSTRELQNLHNTDFVSGLSRAYDRVYEKYKKLVDYIRYSKRHNKSSDSIFKYGTKKLALPVWFITESISRQDLSL